MMESKDAPMADDPEELAVQEPEKGRAPRQPSEYKILVPLKGDEEAWRVKTTVRGMSPADARRHAFESDNEIREAARTPDGIRVLAISVARWRPRHFHVTTREQLEEG
jgi:hypothetical protein